jgi:hypothetical protein
MATVIDCHTKAVVGWDRSLMVNPCRFGGNAAGLVTWRRMMFKVLAKDI